MPDNVQHEMDHEIQRIDATYTQDQIEIGVTIKETYKLLLRMITLITTPFSAMQGLQENRDDETDVLDALDRTRSEMCRWKDDVDKLKSTIRDIMHPIQHHSYCETVTQTIPNG